jgi:hypothetical protein
VEDEVYSCCLQERLAARRRVDGNIVYVNCYSRHRCLLLISAKYKLSSHKYKNWPFVSSYFVAVGEVVSYTSSYTTSSDKISDFRNAVVQRHGGHHNT